MSRYIDADELKNRFERERLYLVHRGELGAEYILVHHAIPLVDDIPTADVVERKMDSEPIPHWRGQDGHNLPFQLEEGDTDEQIY